MNKIFEDLKTSYDVLKNERGLHPASEQALAAFLDLNSRLERLEQLSEPAGGEILGYCENCEAPLYAYSPMNLCSPECAKAYGNQELRPDGKSPIQVLNAKYNALMRLREQIADLKEQLGKKIKENIEDVFQLEIVRANLEELKTKQNSIK